MVRRIVLVFVIAAGCGGDDDSLPAPDCTTGVTTVAETMADEVDGIWGENLAVDARGVYYTLYNAGGIEEHAIARIQPAGGEPERLWQGPGTGLFGRGLAVDDRVYFYASGEVGAPNALYAVPVGGGDLQTLATFPESSNNLAVALDPGNVYVARSGDVVRVPRAGGADPMTVYSSSVEPVRAMAAGGGVIYFLTDAALRKVGPSGALSSVSASGGIGLAIVGPNAYVLRPDAVVQVDLQTGVETPVASGLTDADELAADASGIYVAFGLTEPERNGTILAIQTSAPPLVLAEGVAAAKLALDADSVWFSGLGQLGRVGRCSITAP